ncbi:AAA family ATPase [Bacillus daqingensis]|uniref:AAA family ATPase n=1 Tax=Bacillus daqingensis TaxID=872396 RepID=A0ABV9NSI1_9BACI
MTEQLTTQMKREIQQKLIGKDETVELLWISLLAEGHVLLDDLPGTGKSELASAFAAAIGATSGRIQGTSDVTPADITGFDYFNKQTGAFTFRPGPVFHHVLLADEINRASPRAQAGLLEAMAEKQVTVEGTTHALTDPFFVIATQNPVDVQQGTFKLPQAQLDRFMMKLPMKTLRFDEKRAMLEQHRGPVRPVTAVTSMEEIRTLRDKVRHVEVHEDVETYLLQLIEATGTVEETLFEASPRAAVALLRAAQARALIQDRRYVKPEDIVMLAEPVLAHRLILNSRAVLTTDPKDVVQHALDSLSVPAD